MIDICQTILNLYIKGCNEIECDFILEDGDKGISVQGKAIVKKYLYPNSQVFIDNDIKIYGNLKDINFNSNPSNVIVFNTNDITTDYKCTLLNFPKENRREEVLGNIQITFPRVRVSPNFEIIIDSDISIFKGEIQPLYTYEKGEVMIINIEEYTEITTIELFNNYKDNWEVQFKLPTVDLWLDYDMKTSSLISMIVFHQLGAVWRYKVK